MSLSQLLYFVFCVSVIDEIHSCAPYFQTDEFKVNKQFFEQGVGCREPFVEPGRIGIQLRDLNQHKICEKLYIARAYAQMVCSNWNKFVTEVVCKTVTHTGGGKDPNFVTFHFACKAAHNQQTEMQVKWSEVENTAWMYCSNRFRQAYLDWRRSHGGNPFGDLFTRQSDGRMTRLNYTTINNIVNNTIILYVVDYAFKNAPSDTQVKAVVKTDGSPVTDWRSVQKIVDDNRRRRTVQNQTIVFMTPDGVVRKVVSIIVLPDWKGRETTSSTTTTKTITTTQVMTSRSTSTQKSTAVTWQSQIGSETNDSALTVVLHNSTDFATESLDVTEAVTTRTPIAVCETEQPLLDKFVHCTLLKYETMDTAKQCCYFGFDVQAEASLFLHGNKSCLTCSAYQIENGDMNAVSAYFLDKTRIGQVVTVPAE